MPSLIHLQHFFLKRVINDALEEHDRKVSTGCKTITNLPFSDDIGDCVEEEQTPEALV